MKTKLEFLFRMIQVTNHNLNDAGLNQREIEDTCSLIASVGLNLIYQRREDGRFQFNPQEQANTTAFAQVVIDKFTTIQRKIVRECAGYPITLRISRQELLAMEGIDELMEILKGLMVKEVSNG